MFNNSVTNQRIIDTIHNQRNFCSSSSSLHIMYSCINYKNLNKQKQRMGKSITGWISYLRIFIFSHLFFLASDLLLFGRKGDKKSN